MNNVVIEKNRIVNIDEKLNEINTQLEQYTNEAGSTEYAIAVFCGLISGAIDSLIIGESSYVQKNHEVDIAVNKFIQAFANEVKPGENMRLDKAISLLEKEYPVAQDNIWKGASIGVSAKNHHLDDLAHHPTPLGLVAALAAQFLRVGIFISRDGKWHIQHIKTDPAEMVGIITPLLLSGFLKWLVDIAEDHYEDNAGKEMPKGLKTLLDLVAATPVIKEVIKCTENWVGHLVSDMGGSKNTAGGGMGIPGVFVSLLHEISGLPGFKDSGLPAFVNDLYVKNKIDLRKEIPVYKALSRQAIPVLINDVIVRMAFMTKRFCEEYSIHKDIKTMDWSRILPYNNRTVTRMVTIADMTFSVADTADAAIRAAVESAGNWVIFSGKFVARYNFVGAGKAAFSIVKEISAENKECELIHEKKILTEAKAKQVFEQIEKYKEALNARLVDFLEEDISAFINGFDIIEKGMLAGNSDKVIEGNVIIQETLNSDIQFKNQNEFDQLMSSDEDLIL